ncbi:MAG: hypothetical protein GYB68_16185 [Chloroflexi bacterium]|nr:hypothetical protein [Chloroflexota bacterium]
MTKARPQTKMDGFKRLKENYRMRIPLGIAIVFGGAIIFLVAGTDWVLIGISAVIAVIGLLIVPSPKEMRQFRAELGLPEDPPKRSKRGQDE